MTGSGRATGGRSPTAGTGIVPGEGGGRGIRTREEREAPNGFQDSHGPSRPVPLTTSTFPVRPVVAGQAASRASSSFAVVPVCSGPSVSVVCPFQ
jgi:hypothetical protein